ncbi:unnamed protein product [Calicophoron daubneyi]|uniref:Uncharacterized protein n=1 Tax=Calicophoron daubneyi TaxID=300641 RepID=A0AAV2THR3_CALDB
MEEPVRTDPVQIGDRPKGGRPGISVRPTVVLVFISLLLSCLLGIIGSAVNPSTAGGLSSARRNAALAFSVIGLILSFVAAVLYIFVVIEKFGDKRFFALSVLILSCVTCVCYIISTAIAYGATIPFFGAWTLSALWVSVVGAVVVVVTLFLDLEA